MAHKALYRKFRPRHFSELKGQTTTAAILRGQIASGEPSHAYLFSGPRGTGKTSAAKITAMALVCQNPQEGEPCLECENCKAALADNMPDIIEMDAASNNSVENARDLRESVALMPVRADRKVYIIDEVHMLTRSAFNALLKTLEEPPEHVVFILATTELQKLPATVLSRCQRFDFRRIGDSEIKERMREVLEAEGGKAEDEALGMIARAAGGALRDALSMLDKCISLGGEITADSVRELIGLADADAISAMVDSALLGDAKNALKVLAELTDEGAQPAALANAMMNELSGRLEKDAGAQVVFALEILADTEVKLRYTTAPTVQLETAVARIALGAGETTAALLARIERLEKRPAQAAAAPESEPKRQKPQKPKKPEPKPDSELAKAWEASCKKLAEQGGVALKPFFALVRPVGISGGGSVVLRAADYDRYFKAHMMMDNVRATKFEEILSEEMGKKLRIELETQEKPDENAGIEFID